MPQHGASTVGMPWEFQSANPCFVLGAGSGGAGAAGRIQHWQDPRLGDEC